MALDVSPDRVCMVVCHAGPAEHFSVFAERLRADGKSVEVWATGPAVQKLKGTSVTVHQFELIEGTHENTAREIAQKCSGASCVITDMGHPFAETVHQQLRQLGGRATQIGYYDNLEKHVPGGYSDTAQKVARCVKIILFANAELAFCSTKDVFQENLSVKRIGLGYYPLEAAYDLRNTRQRDKELKRREFFSKEGISDTGQKILVYTGGNNEVYFEKAFPACLELFQRLSQEKDLSDMIFLFQQHPGAKGENRDGERLGRWILENQANTKMPRVIFSQLGTDDALVFGDMVLYYQTSMGPKFIVAGVPAIQIGHLSYEDPDILVRNGLARDVHQSKALSEALKQSSDQQEERKIDQLKGALGMREDWFDTLRCVLSSTVSKIC